MKKRKNEAAIIYLSTGDSSANPSPNFTLTKAFLYHDTIHIGAALGFFGGYSIEIKISNNQFTGLFGMETGNALVLKQKPSDSIYLSSIEALPVKQKLILSEIPKFINGEIITGEFVGHFQSFYFYNVGIDELMKPNVRVVFKCRIVDYNKVDNLLKAN